MNEEAVLRSAQSLFYERAMVSFRGETVGALAAIPSNAASDDLNYQEIFIRDNVPVAFYLLLEGKIEIVRYFLDTCLSLQSKSFQTLGLFPTSFVETSEGVKVDYGQRAIGRVCSVDATLWWSILAYIYVQRSGDREWACKPEVQMGLYLFLNLVLHPGFRDAPTLFVPDGAFMIDRPLDVWGMPIEIQTLLYGALKSAAGLLYIDLQRKGVLTAQGLQHVGIDSFTQRQLFQLQYAIDWVKRLRNYLLKHFWINSNIVQMLRRRPTEEYGEGAVNEYNINTETIPNWLQQWLGARGGYLIGNIRTGRPDFRFFTLGNCLGAIFDTMSIAQQRSLFHLILHNRGELFAQMPLRICHPPLEDADWRKKTGYDRKNLPWSYHNSGHWPCLLWFLVIAVLRQRENLGKRTVEERKMEALLREAYELMLHRLPKQKWAEYFDGPTGTWMGQQSRVYQTWTIVGFLLVHHLLKKEPRDACIMNLPTLRFLHEISRPLQELTSFC